MRFSCFYITEMLNTNIGIVGFALTECPVCVDKTKLDNNCSNLMFIGPCIIVITEE